jgi:hypothetical protein
MVRCTLADDPRAVSGCCGTCPALRNGCDEMPIALHNAIHLAQFAWQTPAAVGRLFCRPGNTAEEAAHAVN